MSEWYIRSDHDHVKLSRILDIAQDLKVKLNICTIEFFDLILLLITIIFFLYVYITRPCLYY